ncbi:hypothetical protein LZ31DRAFT_128492 [Colletotrichum somersetense]|nr:hypothetical protein LZ31DRAFT_128492 [Colletotrichum somersetense]
MEPYSVPYYVQLDPVFLQSNGQAQGTCLLRHGQGTSGEQTSRGVGLSGWRSAPGSSAHINLILTRACEQTCRNRGRARQTDEMSDRESTRCPGSYPAANYCTLSVIVGLQHIVSKDREARYQVFQTAAYSTEPPGEGAEEVGLPDANARPVFIRRPPSTTSPTPDNQTPPAPPGIYTERRYSCGFLV